MHYSSVPWEILVCIFLAETVHDVDKRSQSNCKMSAKMVQRSYVSWPWRAVQNFLKNWFFVLKMTRIWCILTWALENLKNFHFDWLLVCKVFNVWPKKVHRSYLSWHKSDAKFEKIRLVVWKMTWGFWQIFSRALESVKIGTLIRSFCPK